MADHNPVQEGFFTFLEGWLARQRGFLDQLQLMLATISESQEDPKAMNDEPQRHLIEQVLGHYQQYFNEKSRAAQEDVFVIFSPPWLSSFERTLLWLAGFKPSLILRMVETSVADLTAEQETELGRVRSETGRSERELSEAMARVQERVAAPPILSVARRVGRLMDGEIGTLDEVMDGLRSAMLDVIEKADRLRGSTVRKVVEVLSPNQTLKVLAAVARFQLRIRSLGFQRDQHNNNPNGY